MASLQHQIVPTRGRAKQLTRVNTTSHQDDAVTTRRRVNTMPFQKTASCQQHVVPILRRSRRHRVKMSPCQHDVVSRRRHAINDVVCIRHRVKTASCQHDDLSRQRRTKTVSCQYGAVSRRYHVKMTSCQYGVVSRRCRVKN